MTPRGFDCYQPTPETAEKQRDIGRRIVGAITTEDDPLSVTMVLLFLSSRMSYLCRGLSEASFLENARRLYQQSQRPPPVPALQAAALMKSLLRSIEGYQECVQLAQTDLNAPCDNS